MVTRNVDATRSSRALTLLVYVATVFILASPFMRLRTPAQGNPNLWGAELLGAASFIALFGWPSLVASWSSHNPAARPIAFFAFGVANIAAFVYGVTSNSLSGLMMVVVCTGSAFLIGSDVIGLLFRHLGYIEANPNPL